MSPEPRLAAIVAEKARMFDEEFSECGSERIARAEERYWKTQRLDSDVTK